VIIGGANTSNIDVRSWQNLGTNTNIKTYTGLTSNVVNIIHDKDLDSNIYYSINSVSKQLNKHVLTQGATSITTTMMYNMTSTNSNYTSKGATYVPAFMGTSNGCIVVGGNDRHLVHIMELNTTKTSVSYEYSMIYSNAVGVEVIPKDVSGFSNDYLIVCADSRVISTFVADFGRRTFSNQADTNVPPGLFPSAPVSMMYFPPGKPVYNTDANSNLHELLITDAAGNGMSIFTVTQANETSLTFNHEQQYNVYGPGNSLGEYPYPLTVNAYNSLI
jgi:hypothetical protein